MHPDFSAAKIEKSAQITQANTVKPFCCPTFH